ncbi:hypothetical protein TSOC_001723 [Tetrabaena socialis]|uniref:EamA domain-containing protein n=1 Tax=Tetrabaena socialis TaxID=47790 RepID=A0A2J8AG03_9CHLO|nr:hypothetical protein TSOC_001723 [Tetrabaena socialis]|eukprot:PNH11447.1 hypothetical protein TSOC_001723 [Tetrabaena socialis]
MPSGGLLSARTSAREDLPPSAAGLHHLHGHRPHRISAGSLVLDSPHRPGAPHRPGTGPDGTQLYGIVSLLAVAALWGSYSPCLKFLFTQPVPPSAALVTAAQALLAAAFLLAGIAGTPYVGGGGVSGGAKHGGGGVVAAATAALTAVLQRFGGGAGLAGLLRPLLRALPGAIARRGQRFLPKHPPPQPHHHLHTQGSALDGGEGAVVQGPVHAHHHGAAQPHSRAASSSSLRMLNLQAAGGGAAEGVAGAAHSLDGGHSSSSGGAGGGVGQAAAGMLGVGGPFAVAPAVGPVGPAAVAVAAAVAAASGSGPLLGGFARPPRGGGGSVLSRPLGSLVAAGLELGTYNFVAVALATWGVQRISATKVAFLGQATSLITPLLLALSGQRVAAVVWGACCAGALGGALVALDGTGRAAAAAAAVAAGAVVGGAGVGVGAGGVGLEGAVAPPAVPVGGGSRSMRLEVSSSSAAAAAALLSDSAAHLAPAVSQESLGATYVLARWGCVFYALGTVRMGVHSGRFPPLQLAAAAGVAYAALSLVWLGWEMLASSGGDENPACASGAGFFTGLEDFTDLYGSGSNVRWGRPLGFGGGV